MPRTIVSDQDPLFSYETLWSHLFRLAGTRLAKTVVYRPQADGLTERVLHLDGPDCVPVALRVTAAARALDRIADHTVVLGARIRYMLTGEPAHLAAEVR